MGDAGAGAGAGASQAGATPSNAPAGSAARPVALSATAASEATDQANRREIPSRQQADATPNVVDLKQLTVAEDSQRKSVKKKRADLIAAQLQISDAIPESASSSNNAGLNAI